MKKDFQNDIALLKEMISGLEKESKEKAILASMIDVMEKLNDKVDSYYKDLEEYVDSVDRDLSEVKLDMYGLEEDFKEELDEELNIEDDKETRYIEIPCKNCNEIIYMDEEWIKIALREILRAIFFIYLSYIFYVS